MKIKTLARYRLSLGRLLAGLSLAASISLDQAFAQGPWTASLGFSSTQGANQWSYQAQPQGGGTATNLSYNTDGYDVWWTSDGTGWIGNYQGVADTHPGQHSDTLRTWTAPAAGTVSITGRVYKIDTGGGAGVIATVKHNGTAIWTRTLAYDDGIGYTTDADLGSVAVTAGDTISFVVDDNGTYSSDETGWDPTITMGGSYTAFTGFSSTEGANQWSYQERPQGGGAVTNLGYNTDGYDVWWTSDGTGWIGDYEGVADTHPGQHSDTLRTWTAPAAGTASITGRVYKIDTGGGAGIVASVEHNGTSLWEQTVAYNDTTGYTTDAVAALGAIPVTAGDTISFVVDDNGTYGYDETGWNPTVQLSRSSAPTWVLNTNDTLLTLTIIGNRPAITRLEDANPATAWNWTPAPIALPLPAKVYIGSTLNCPDWSYSSSSTDTSNGTKVTLTFVSTAPSLTLTQVWWARPGVGPVEVTTALANGSGSAATVDFADLVAIDLTATSDQSPTLWRFNRSNVNQSADTGFTTGVFQTALGSSQSVYSVVSDITSAGNYLLPFVMLDAGGTHGLYVGYESDFGFFSANTYGNADVVRTLFSLGNPPYSGNPPSTGSFTIAAGSTVNLPGVFYGTYTGNIEVGSNHMKKWFWNNEITPTIKTTTNEPLVEVCINDGTPATSGEAGADAFFSNFPVSSWGIELGKEDAGWGDDQSSGNSYGFDWNPELTSGDANDWPSGMDLANLAHGNGVLLSLYMANTYNHADLSTAAGVSAEEAALESRYNGTASGWVGAGYDYWRSDINCEAPLNYLSHQGFLAVLDYMIANHANFRWENCSAGGSKKSFDLLQRQTVMTVEDSGGGAGSVENYRMAYYANSYMINPVQLKSDNINFTPNTQSFYRYQFRDGYLGAWMSIAQSQTGSDYQFYQQAEYVADIALYKTYQRPILRGADVYHILPICDSVHWDGIEFFNSSLNAGSVVLFKPNSGVGNSPAIVLQGLNPTSTYTLTFQDRPSLNYSASGGTLMTSGISPISGNSSDYDSEVIWINQGNIP